MKIKSIILTIFLMGITLCVNAQLKVTQTGNVGIGNNVPLTKLHVVGNSTFTATTSTTIPSAAYIRGLNSYSTATTPDYAWFNNDQTGIFHPSANNIGFSTGGTERLRINENGDMIIKGKSMLMNNHWTGGLVVAEVNFAGYSMPTTYPNSDWYGALGTSNFKYAAGYIDRIWYGSLTCTSDINIKENIKDVSNITDKIKKLRPVNFDFKASYYNSAKGDYKAKLLDNRKNKVGFIAQEVSELFPDIVCKDGNNGLLGINYIDFIPYIVQAFKEQQLQIETLQKDLANCCENTKSTRSIDNTTGQNYTDNANNNTMHETKLYQNSPNPFSESTTIKYTLSGNIQNASILIFDMQGILLNENL